MKVREVMSFEPVSVNPDMPLKKAAQIMIRHGIGSLLVQKDNDIVGILAESDIVKAFAKSVPAGTEVKKIMTKGVITVEANATLEKAARTMTMYNIKKLPVVDKGICVGIVTATDLITYEERLIDKLATLLVVRNKRSAGG